MNDLAESRLAMCVVTSTSDGLVTVNPIQLTDSRVPLQTPALLVSGSRAVASPGSPMTPERFIAWQQWLRKRGFKVEVRQVASAE